MYGHFGKRSATLGLMVALWLFTDYEGGLVVEDDALLGEGGDGRVAVGGDV